MFQWRELLSTKTFYILNYFCTFIRSAEFSKSNGNSFSKLLSGLATFDALFLFLAITSFGLPVLSEWYSEILFLPITPVAFGLLHTFRVGSVYMLLAVTVERFYAILFPFKRFRWKKYLLPGAIIIAVTYNIPKYFELHLEVSKNAFMEFVFWVKFENFLITRQTVLPDWNSFHFLLVYFCINLGSKGWLEVPGFKLR